MNVETIKMEPEEAIAKLKAYRDNLKRKKRSETQRHITEEFKTATKLLRELGKGHVILDIEEVIRNAPIDAKERPRLAICRADLKQVKFEWYANSDASFIGKTDYKWGEWLSRNKDICINIPMQREHHYREVRPYNKEAGPQPATLIGYSLVPLIPPSIEMTAKIENYHILWEIEQWSDTEIGAKPDKDPYLLRRLNSTLFAVVAEWDLTEVERLVMKNRI